MVCQVSVLIEYNLVKLNISNRIRPGRNNSENSSRMERAGSTLKQKFGTERVASVDRKDNW